MASKKKPFAVTVEEAARIMGISIGHVRSLLRGGALQPVAWENGKPTGAVVVYRSIERLARRWGFELNELT